MQRLKLQLVHWLPRHLLLIEGVIIIACAFIVASQPAFAADVVRLQKRSLLVNSPEPGILSNYKFSFIYSTPANIGSVDIQFCLNPIPDEPCNVPVGFDASNAVLAEQTGETGYTILSKTTNRIILTRPPTATGSDQSTYTFTNIRNPSEMSRSFSARLGTHTSTNATDPFPYVNLGSVLSQTIDGTFLETQVPPILIFCLGHEVSADCGELNGGNYTDMGDLSSTKTLMASSQMAAGTNATGGYVITVNGTTMQAGTSVIKNLEAPTPSRAGVPQFGINLRANSQPEIGDDPDGSWSNAHPEANYAIPDSFTFNNGDAVASSSEVSLERRFTVSYIVNSPEDLRPGVYTTTLTYICSGRF
jgi:hypothetical protein